MAGHFSELAANRVEIGQIFGVCILGARRFCLPVGHDRALVNPLGQLTQPLREAADRLAKSRWIDGADIDQALDSAAAEFFRGHRPDSPQGVHRQFLKKRLDALGADDRKTVRFLPARGNLGEKLVRRHTR